jgi:vancomycin resistance protein YoaR
MAKAGRFAGVLVRRVLLLAGGVILACGALVALTSVLEHVWYSGSVLPGVRLEGVHVAGSKEHSARASIERLAAELDRTPIRAHAGSRTFAVDPSLIGFSVDTEATLRAARETGRNANPLTLVADTVLRRFRPDDVKLVVRYDENRFAGLLDGWANALRSGLVEGDLRFEGTKVVPVAPHAGSGLLRDQAAQDLRALLTSSSRPDLALPIGAVRPEIDAAAVDAAAAHARSVLSGSYVVVAGANRVTLTPAQVALTLGTRANGRKLDLTVDGTKLRAVLGPAVTAVEQPPVDATFDTSNPDAVTVVPSRDGHQLDTDAIGRAVVRGQRTIAATFRDEHPKRDTAWAQRLGITHQVSSFTTNYTAGQPRVHNIQLAADTIDGTVVEPGETFSENGVLGQRTPEKGYVKAPILVEDGFGEDYGGGISQLSTTLFNAVFFGGYVDVTHSPHRFYISRYPMGREATIVWPYVDLKFRNDTKHGVLIRATYSSTSVTVTFFGDTDGRTAKEANRKIVHTEPITDRTVPCPAEKPADDPNNDCAKLTAFERKTVATGETGYDVAFDRVIEQPGKPTIVQHYRVHYPMLQNTVLVGTVPPTTTTSPTTTKAKSPSPSTTKGPPKAATTTTLRHS